MSEEPESIDTKSKKAKADFCEVEFEIGNIEFEAKGKSAVVERLFRLLLEKIEQGKLVATLQLPEEDDEEEEEEESEIEELLQESTPSDRPPAPPEEDSIPSEAYLDPPPAWDSLEEDSPPMSDAEKESLDDSL
ncbi:MAG: hypothetical protein P1Q69_14265 [Candidatus Thorarchaeota archaeon]|nr:hypothetical protein [Candidatus Thorarchaeota archaeon]